MALAIITETAPLETTKDGVVVIHKTRVTLDTIVAIFNQGATAEEIIYRYPSLKLADVYATIAGRMAYLSGRMPMKDYASASSPLTGTITG